jgi:phosphomannomutase/phosphoglucomutase
MQSITPSSSSPSSKNSRLFGTNGVRGIYGQDLTHELIIDLCYALGTYFKTGTIVVGNDGRKSSPVLSKIVRATLNSAGLDTANAGLVPTPCLQYASKRLGYSGGIMITASHNPPPYNGIKPTAPDGVEISRENELLVEEIYYSKKFTRIDGTSHDFTDDKVVSSYIEAVLALVDVDKIREQKFTVAMDTGNGAQAIVAPLIAKKLGCKVIVINGEIDGNFPGRGSEPTPENLGMLANTVRYAKADLGVAYDGDGDRSIFCDELGSIYMGDKTGALLVRHLLQGKNRGAEVICPINTSMILSNVVKDAGSKVIHTRVGSVEVSREMVKRRCPIGLEENGGFMYGPLNEVRDGAMATALILDMLASSSSSSSSSSNKKSLLMSKLIAQLPQTFQFKTKFVCSSRAAVDTAIQTCIEHGNPLKVETLDGAKIWIDEETWLMVRPSGTEPLIRMYAESTDKSLLDSKVEEYKRIVQSKI